MLYKINYQPVSGESGTYDISSIQLNAYDFEDDHPTWVDALLRPFQLHNTSRHKGGFSGDCQRCSNHTLLENLS